jgi:hypothetical protein
VQADSIVSITIGCMGPVINTSALVMITPDDVA